MIESDFEKYLDKPLQPWTVRNGFPDWLVALVWLVVAFVGFQLLANIFAISFIFLDAGVPNNFGDMMQVLQENMRWVFVGNSIGQVFVLALLTFVVAKISVLKQDFSAFLGFQKGVHTAKFLGISAVLILAVQPLIWWLGYLNSLLPFSESYLEFEKQQIDLLNNFLISEPSLVFVLINVAVVPAICEEILFRGYFYKMISRSTGVFWAILISGILFGLYHIKLTQAIPLSLIGILLAWLTFKSGSIFPAMLVHFINNGASVLAAFFYPDEALSLGEEYLPEWWMIVLSIAATAFCILLLNHLTKKGDENV